MASKKKGELKDLLRRNKELRKEINVIKKQIGIVEESKKDLISNFPMPYFHYWTKDIYPDPPLHERLQMLMDYLGVEIKKKESSVKIVKKKGE